MGLDWNPIGKPTPGDEEEFERLFYILGNGQADNGWLDKLKHIFSRIDRDSVSKRWFEIQISPFVTVQAPQVGKDLKADDWARAKYKDNPPEDKTEEKFLAELKDYYVVALAPPCDGIPYYSNGPSGYVELFSFRAQFITNECADIIGEALLEKCYHSCLAPGLASLATEIRACAEAYASRHGVSSVEAVRDLDAPEGSPAAKAHILFSAARWCEYWSSRGHGLEAYF